jgi:RNA polymerase-binding transcription factor DksA
VRIFALEPTRSDLLARLESVRGRLGAIDAPEASARGDEGDLSVHQDLRDLTAADRSRLLEQAGRIRRALVRLRIGTYADCLTCAAPIAIKRLTAIPEVEACLSCQELAERVADHDGAAARVARRQHAWEEDEA